MKIGIITPAPPRSLDGNRVTALRWARLLGRLGHSVTIAQSYADQPLDALIALHAKRSHEAIKSFHRLHPGKPLVVALTGTDLYRDLKHSKRAQLSLELATRLVVLQPKAFDDLSSHLHHKTRVIYQSVKPNKPTTDHQPPTTCFTVCVIGHLREVKDPFRAAMAARLLPAGSRVQILHAGRAMSEALAARAEREMRINPRYCWLGEQRRSRVRQILMRSQL